MKTTLLKFTIVLAALACLAPVSRADEKSGDHKHEKKIVAGPKGGRLLETTPAAEFFVEKDHIVSLTLYGKDLKPIAVKKESATLVTDVKGDKKKIEMEKKGDVLVSKTALPKGDGYNVIVQFKAAPDAKPKNFRIPLDMSTCSGCKRVEYACTCDE